MIKYIILFAFSFISLECFSQARTMITPSKTLANQMDTTMIFDLPKTDEKTNYYGALTDEETERYTKLGFVLVAAGENLWAWKNNPEVRFYCAGKVLVKKLVTENQITHICMSCGEKGSMECWDVDQNTKK